MIHAIRTAFLGLPLAALALAGCASSKVYGVEGPAAATVTLAHFQFAPQEVRIKAGEIVEWKNESSIVPHTVTDDPAQNAKLSSLPAGAQAFDQDLSPGETFRRAFTVKGTYHYYCKPHGEDHGMTGTIIVE